MLKRGFSFFELLVVITLIAVFYGLFIPKLNWNDKLKKSDELVNLKQSLINKFDYKKSLRLICIKEEKECFVIVDNKLEEKKKYTSLFSGLPETYEYQNKEELLDLGNIELEALQNEELIFDFQINQDRKIDEMIIQNNDIFYVYNNLSQEALVFENFEEIQTHFENNINEVKDAF